MSLNVGLRYETQNSIHDHSDFAPRLDPTWAPGNGKNKRTVLRAGFGIFYDRFEATQVLQDERLDGVTQMRHFYHHLAEGQDEGRALQRAKLELIEQFRDQSAPLFWAGFTLAGEASRPIESVQH